MHDLSPWFERKFEFTFPVEQFPSICVRLRGAPARLEEMLRGVAGEILLRKPPGKWSAQEHAGHLLDLEELWMARVLNFLDGATELAAADLTNRKTHEANHNAVAVAQILSCFRRARMQLVDRTENIDSSVFGRSLLHPRLKTPMRLGDHLYFVAEHDDHHIAHIWQLLRKDWHFKE